MISCGGRDDPVAVSGAVCRGGGCIASNGEDWATEGAGDENVGPAQDWEGCGHGEDVSVHHVSDPVVKYREHCQDPEQGVEARDSHSHGPSAVENAPSQGFAYW